LATTDDPTATATTERPTKTDSVPASVRIAQLEAEVERLRGLLFEHVHRLGGLQNYVGTAVRIKDGLFEPLPEGGR
jgi:hypothetical protein